MAESNSDDGPRTTGIAALAFFALWLCGWFIWVGWPASGCALALLLLWGLLKFLKGALEKAKSPEPRIWRAVLTGGTDSAGKAALWAAIGCCLVWIVQFLLVEVIPDPTPSTMGDAEIWLANAAAAIHDRMTLAAVAVALAAALVLSLLVGALWPIGAAAWVKNTAGRLLAVVSAVTAFSFVGLNDANARYEQVSGVLRSQIVYDLSSLIVVRQEAAAWHWLSSVAQQQTSGAKELAAKWREHFATPLAACARDNDNYARGYHRAADSTFSLPRLDRDSGFCDRPELVSELIRTTITLAPARGTPASQMDWLYDFRSDLTGASGTIIYAEGKDFTKTFDLAGRLKRFADLQALAIRVRAKLNDAETARDSLQGVATEAVGQILEGVLPSDVNDIAGYWMSALLDEIAHRGVSKATAWVRSRAAPKNGVLVALLAVDESGTALHTPEAADGERLYDDFLKSQNKPTGLDAEHLAGLGENEAHEHAQRLAEAAEARRSYEARYQSPAERRVEFRSAPHGR